MFLTNFTGERILELVIFIHPHYSMKSLIRYNSFLTICKVLLWGLLTTGVFFSLWYTQEFTDYRDYFDYYDIEVVNEPWIDLTYPSRAQPNPEQDNTDLDYWVNEVLPFDQDKDADTYLVYPEHWIVVPIVQPTQADQALINKGESFNHYPYLENGWIFYYGSSPVQSKGNMVIAAHSSYKEDDPGRYKTVFQALPISRAGDKIFVYIKNNQGSFDFFEYEIFDSYATEATNVSVLNQNVSEYTLTTYGCYVIGSNEDRRINQATLVHKESNHSKLGQSMHGAAPEQTRPALPEKDSETTEATTETAWDYTTTVKQRKPESLEVAKLPETASDTTSTSSAKPNIIHTLKKQLAKRSVRTSETVDTLQEAWDSSNDSDNTSDTDGNKLLKNHIKAQNTGKTHAAASSDTPLDLIDTNTMDSPKDEQQKRTIQHVKQPKNTFPSIYDTLRARNQYVFNGTLPHEVIRARLAARLGRNITHSAGEEDSKEKNQKDNTTAPTSKQSLFDSASTLQTVMLYKKIINLATNDISIAEKILERIETLLQQYDTNSTDKKYILLKNIHTKLNSLVE